MLRLLSTISGTNTSFGPTTTEMVMQQIQTSLTSLISTSIRELAPSPHQLQRNLDGSSVLVKPSSQRITLTLVLINSQSTDKLSTEFAIGSTTFVWKM